MSQEELVTLLKTLNEYLRVLQPTLSLWMELTTERTRQKIANGIKMTDFVNDRYEFSVRVNKCLRVEGVRTVEDLIQKTELDLLRHKGFGETSLNEVKIKLAADGLSLRRNNDLTDA